MTGGTDASRQTDMGDRNAGNAGSWGRDASQRDIRGASCYGRAQIPEDRQTWEVGTQGTQRARVGMRTSVTSEEHSVCYGRAHILGEDRHEGWERSGTTLPCMVTDDYHHHENHSFHHMALTVFRDIRNTILIVSPLRKSVRGYGAWTMARGMPASVTTRGTESHDKAQIRADHISV